MKWLRHLVCIMGVGLTATTVTAQNSDNMLVAADSEFVMQVVREKGEIILTVNFAPTSTFDYMTIERKPFGETNFSQCKYVTYADAKAADMKVKRKDTYPLPRTDDVLYRLKITTKEGIIRIFPPVRLAALDAPKQ